MSQQYIRAVGLVVTAGASSSTGSGSTTADGPGIDLSSMHIQFHTFAPDTDSPGQAVIRVWNLSENTANQIQKEFNHVILQAGYVDPGPALIFSGTITQTKKGAESAIDSYIDIFAADLDQFYTNTLVSKTLAAGSTTKDHVAAIIQAGQASGAQQGAIPDSLGTGGTLPRGKVLFGMAREQMNNVAVSTSTSWFVENGKVNMVEDTGYLPGDIVVINSQTGMLGVPEQTNQGIEVKCLLNPNIKIGTRVQLNNADIVNNQVNQNVPQNATNLIANKSADGVYRVLVKEHSGDNRGNDWTSSLVCLSQDSSASANSSVQADG